MDLNDFIPTLTEENDSDGYSEMLTSQIVKHDERIVLVIQIYIYNILKKRKVRHLIFIC